MRNVLLFALCLAIFIGGLLLIGYAFTVPGFQAVIFFSGILAITLSFLIPIGILRKSDH